ncbi:YtpI family protein [Macrococcus equipercicus]|uniref:YtpI family protein n=1 Tax=Macrococcus equipercicus TaxID=69967 RepID=A0A9Q9F0N7_9STAP|nr:YtpI family protein [Macrococcus equipercicus]UTH13153.1 YtpI family protein [Macrococcus equipercicus]
MWQTIFPYIISVTVLIMIITFMLSLYQFAKYFRTNRDVRRAWHRARGRMMFGIFMIAFAGNQLLLFSSAVTYIICAVLIVFGLANINYGIKAGRYFEQYFDEEDRAWAELDKDKKA